MISRENTVVLSERAEHLGRQLEVDNVGGSVGIKAESAKRNAQQNREPFPVVTVAKYRGLGIPVKRIVRLYTERFKTE